MVGGGPAGLMAAQLIAQAGLPVGLYDGMPSVGRKFLLAGRGGLNLTHAEPRDAFLSRYGPRRAAIAGWLADFGPEELRAWASGLGIATFVGSSGRVFPDEMKSAPLLRAWLHRLRASGVRFHMRHRLLGWTADGRQLRFATPAGETTVQAAAVVLALGGGSWARLGSDGAWVPWLAARNIAVAPLRPANCGFDVGWSNHMLRHAGAAVKSVIASVDSADGGILRQEGEFVIADYGVEGGLIYAFSAQLRDAIGEHGHAILTLDLAPGRSLERLCGELGRPRGRNSLANHLRRQAGITGVKAALLREFASPDALADMARLAAKIKALPLRLAAPRPLDEAISSAGGVDFAGLDEHLMLRAIPGTFCAGEMIDWEAPTGGYLLTACIASGRVAGRGVLRHLGLPTSQEKG